MSTGTARQSSTIRAVEGLTRRGFAEFVDNVDTRARGKIHFILLLEHGARCWGGTTVPIDNIDKVRVGHSRSKLSRARALSHLAAASRSERADGVLYPSFSEAANFDKEKLERAI
jgi:hypothetical protein